MPGFEPRDPDFAERVRRSFARQTMMATIGAVVERVAPGEVDLGLAPAPHILQQHGFVHGGVTATLADTACGFAALSLMPAGVGVLTVEFKINFVAAARGERLVAAGRVIRPGRTLSIVQADVTALDGGAHQLVAVMTATIMGMAGRDGLVD